MSTITTLIKQLANNNEPTILGLQVCKVIAVDKNAGSINVRPINGDADILDVRIKSVIDNEMNGLFFFPEVNSDVLVAFIDNKPTSAFLVGLNDFESVLIIIQNTFKLELNSNGKLSILCDNIDINDGTNGSLIILQRLANEINKLNTFCETFRSALLGAVPSPGDGGLAIKTALLAAINSLPLAVINEQTVGNSKIKH